MYTYKCTNEHKYVMMLDIINLPQHTVDTFVKSGTMALNPLCNVNAKGPILRRLLKDRRQIDILYYIKLSY